MPALELRRVQQRFGDTLALDDISLTVGPGEIVGVTGPSGAGKSTLCRVVSGLETPTAGVVLVDGRGVGGVPPERRGVAFMFESYALYPRLTVFDNVAFPLRAPGMPRLPRPALAERVGELLRLVELDGLERRLPAELSGGQRQRVALCRALVQEPRAYLLDEPISHLDAKLRHMLRGAIRRRLVRTEAPTIWTSPDALDVLAVADRVAVLVGGRLEQVGTPGEIFAQPRTVEVARLVGDPPMNLLSGSLVESGGEIRFSHAAFSVALPAAVGARGRAARLQAGAVLGVRASDIAVVPDTAGAVRGSVWVWEPLGKHGVLSVRLGPDVIKVKVPKAARFEAGADVALELNGEPALFDGATGAAL